MTDTTQQPAELDWHRIEHAPKQEPVLVTSQYFPGWFDIGALTLGEWRRGYVIAGDLMAHAPTHYVRLTPVQKHRMS